jgi:methionine sulfoxide reductase heme-binding subunit
MTFREQTLAFHQGLVANQTLIRLFFWMVYISLFVIILIGFFVFTQSRNLYPQVAGFASTLGKTALLVYTLTLLPGILGRLQFLPELRPPLMLFRRQLGVTMFLMAITHSSLLFTIPALVLGGFSLANLPPNALFGSLALILLLPLWLTSNDTSVRKLGKWWKKIHQLTYIALLFIFLHVAVVRFSIWTGIALTVLVLEAASWLVLWQRSRAAVQQPSSSA